MNTDNQTCDQKNYILSECTEYSMISDEVVSLDFAWTGQKPKAGQFFLVRLERSSVFLGRPISVAHWQSGTLRFVIAIRGKGTKEFADIRVGERAFLTGPLGKGWAEIAGQNHKGKIALISGGVGIAPLACFASELGKKTYDFYAGFKNEPFGHEDLHPHKLVISSEDGSAGFKGRITDFLAPASYNTVYACGPEPMLKAVADKCKAAGVSCYISLERRMACGTGACLGCSIKTSIGNRRCCADGPVFNAEEIFFDE